MEYIMDARLIEGQTVCYMLQKEKPLDRISSFLAITIHINLPYPNQIVSPRSSVLSVLAGSSSAEWQVQEYVSSLLLEVSGTEPGTFACKTCPLSLCHTAAHSKSPTSSGFSCLFPLFFKGGKQTLLYAFICHVYFGSE